ncbi:choice-of-anchor D domain-containing protein [Dyella subtropica]|uniref:choice-of-anchor D domain-containing protein n=1 Tax=Dyella subtropica TaxID=2992127 RepID=UPI0022562900|nr:choice-of-anchor D domain-containing protein [Dyella subtropica]
MRMLRLALCLAPLVVWTDIALCQSWTPLNNAPPITIGYMALATDGTVLAHARTYSSADSQWYKLTPDSTGSYVNGTWTQIASMPAGYAPIDFAGGVLADGKLLIEGGEYNNAQDVESNLGAIYDPVANTWTSVAPPTGWSQIGDASGVILANGTFMLGKQGLFDSALFDEAHLSWTLTGANKPDYNVEEGWALLPNGKVLNVEIDAFQQYNATGTKSELYDPSTGLWSEAGSTVVQLWDSAANCGGASAASYEIGPMVLRPDGTLFATGANKCGAGHTAIYNTATGTWAAGPDFPNGLNIADGPAAVETNGNVLMMASPGIYQSPSTFLEWNGSTLTPVAAPSTASGDSSWYGAMLELPNGQILFSDLSQNLQVWTPSGTYQAAWQPTVSSVSTTLTPGSTYPISGTQFNGVSQGAAYGDDQQMATNYPLVRIVNSATGHVFYCRTHDHSSMGVATGSSPVSTNFDVPSTIETGASELYVVANGIPSAPVSVTVGTSSGGTATLSPARIDFGNVAVNGDSSWQSLILTNNGTAAVWISSVAVSGAAFTDTSYCSGSLAAGSQCVIYVLFHPTSNGTFNGTVTVIDSASNSPQISTLGGTGGTTTGGNISFSGTIASQGQYVFTPNFTSGAGPVTATLNAPAGTKWRFVADNATTNQAVAEQDGTGPLTITFTAAAGNSYNFFVEATSGSGAWSVTGSHP